jgi:hypothetical protein
VTPPRKPAGPRTRRQAVPPLIPGPRPGDKDPPDIGDPYDLPFPDGTRPPGRPAYVIVIDQLRGWQPGQPPSLAELLETRPASTRDPEPDPEAEP